MAKRYYYRTIDGSGWISVKAPRFAHDKTKIEISEEEFINHIKELEKNQPKEEE